MPTLIDLKRRYDVLVVLLACLVATGCGGAEPVPSAGASVVAVNQAFQHHSITLTPIIDPTGDRDDIKAILGPADSDQVVVTVLTTEQQANGYFRAATGKDPMSEVQVGDDIVFLKRNVVVVFDSSLTDYSAETVRAALSEIA